MFECLKNWHDCVSSSDKSQTSESGLGGCLAVKKILARNPTGRVRFLLFFVPFLPFTAKTFLLDWLLYQGSFSSWVLEFAIFHRQIVGIHPRNMYAWAESTLIRSLQVGKADNKSILHIQTHLNDLRGMHRAGYPGSPLTGPASGNLHHGFVANFTLRFFDSKRVRISWFELLSVRIFAGCLENLSLRSSHHVLWWEL